MEILEYINKQFKNGNYETTHHAEKEREEEGISLKDIKNAIIKGQIIEEYPNDPRGKSCLINGLSLDDQPIHVVCGYEKGFPIRIITTYRPQKPKWVSPTVRARKNE
jgi:hypothetical protein